MADYRITAPPGWDEAQNGPFFISYPDADGVYHDHLAGEVCTDIPEVSLPWLAADGLIQDASQPASVAPEPVQEQPEQAVDEPVEEPAVDEEPAVPVPSEGGEQ